MAFPKQGELDLKRGSRGDTTSCARGLPAALSQPEVAAPRAVAVSRTTSLSLASGDVCPVRSLDLTSH